MRTGQVWCIDFLDHYEEATSATWQSIDKLVIKPPLIRAVGTIIGVNKDSVAMAVTTSDGESSCPFVILRSTIVNSTKLEVPPKRRSKINNVT